MELILKETIDSLGREGDVVKVKAGYGRNYLLPQGKAVIANAANLEVLEQNKATIKARLDEERQQAEKLAKQLAGITLEFSALAGEAEKIFGSITAADIADKLAEKNISVERKNVLLAEPIKSLGESQITIKVGFDLNTPITVRVIAQGLES